MTKKLILALLLCVPVFAGQSLNVSTGNYCTWVEASQPASTDWRVEFFSDGWTQPGGTVYWSINNGLGIYIEHQSNNTLFVSYSRPDTLTNVTGSAGITLTGRNSLLVRIQRSHTNSRYTIETWKIDGTGYTLGDWTITSEGSWSGANGQISHGSIGATAKFAFYRTYLSTVPVGSAPPVTAPSSGSPYMHLKFDGNLNDTGGVRNCAGVGSPTYTTTDIGAKLFAKPRTSTYTSWATSIPCRAGHACGLDASGSYTMVDTSDSLTYFWNQLSGPSTAQWSSHTTATPSIAGLTFGPYKFSLRIVDADGNIVTDTLDVGAVSTDSNGVVVHANPDADILFGPMMAVGRNPWVFADEARFAAINARKPGGIYAYPTPGWLTNLPGTISFTPGSASQAAQSTLSASINSTDMTIPVTDASTMDWSNLPALALLHSSSDFNVAEEVRICNQSGNTLTVCYDGRAWRRGLYERVSAPQSWPSGTVIRQVKSVGTGTNFLATFCPAGVGEAGPVYYNTGTVTATAGSTTLTGSGTAWSGALDSRRIRIVGTHGGTPFVFFASIVGAPGSSTSLTLSRAWPADADTASGLSYAVLGTAEYFARSYTRSDSTIGKSQTGVSSCESDTHVYHTDMLNLNVGAQTNKNYHYGGTWVGDLGPNYYDEQDASYAGYFGSGLKVFLDAARAIGDGWTTQPQVDEGWAGGLPRRLSMLGVLVGAVLDGRTSDWYTLRKFAQIAIDSPYSGGVIASTCDADLRESAYGLAWLAYAAKFDPLDTGSPTTPGQRSYWKAKLAEAWARDAACKNAQAGSVFDASYSTNNSAPMPYWGGGTGLTDGLHAAFVLTQNQTTVGGSGFTPDICNRSAGGTATFNTGATSITSTGFVDQSENGKIVVTASRGGSTWMFYSRFVYNSSTSITLLTPYDGDSGTYSWQIESDKAWLAFASGATDYANMNRPHACTYNSSTSLTLDHPWAGTNGTYKASRHIEMGNGTQPFLLGIKIFAAHWASIAATGSTATNYAQFAQDMSEWMRTTGFDANWKGLHYARGFGGCEPMVTTRLNCSSASQENARFLNAEGQTAIRVAYEANPSPTLLTWGDQFYGAQWGKYAGSPYSDGVYLTAVNEVSTWAYKYYGFLFGMGHAHQWPAVRLGGAAAADTRTYTVSCVLPTSIYPTAAKQRVTMQAPSGATTVVVSTCSSPTMDVVVDRRVAAGGTYLRLVEYLNISDVVIAPGEWQTMGVQ